MSCTGPRIRSSTAKVAVKVIAPDLLTPETELRFQTEAQLVAKMDHPSIVSIHGLRSATKAISSSSCRSSKATVFVTT